MLEEIVASKKQELIETKTRLSLQDLLCQIPEQPPVSFTSAITQPGVNIIAEIKYRSPSRGSFACQLPCRDLARIYSSSGAVALSVLTEKNYFAGDLQFLQEIGEELPEVPLLRKDFIVDRYQIVETRCTNASAYLLIVSCLSEGELQGLISYGGDLHLDALVEVHDPFELEKAMKSGAHIIGVNNRNLRSFEVDIDTSFDIARRMAGESGHILISESGIEEDSQIVELRDAGFSAFLIGSTLMDSSDPGAKLGQLRGAE
ncbi:indole-3-glycerol phosphate synthase TrpC [Acidobacteria bacterium AH-259-D05]|nr:indole-3-glycerol phosphate synthase TrpC [Acidobacteria bacterium AH-259-D05]